MNEINERIKVEIEKISLVDTHEHIMSEAERNEYAVDFSYLFGLCNSSDLVSAGMPPRLMEAVRLPMYRYRVAFFKRMRLRQLIPAPAEREDMSLEERWQAMEPFWEAIRNTAYAKQTLITIRDIFGIDDLNRDTYLKLSQAIADFVDYYNYRRYHKALGDVTPADVLYERREQILQGRKEVRIQTINRRRNYNRGLRELVNAA